MSANYKLVADRLSRGETIILDGGTGTDIQRRGAPMSGETWCAEANLTHPEIVKAVHQDYISAGADVITANTFASSALVFNNLGRDHELSMVDNAAVRLAKEAASGSMVAVAGSMSTMRPMSLGSDRNDLSLGWTEAEARQLFRNKARILKDAGIDFIMMELMRDTDYAVWACESALETGLPVWIGVSTERDTAGTLRGWGRADCRFEDIVAALAALKPDAMSVMHSSPNDTDEAIAVLKQYWTGPIGTYPECGYFQSPDWLFVDVISPEGLLDKSRDWRRLGASIFGGCCGIGPDHIAVLAEELRSL